MRLTVVQVSIYDVSHGCFTSSIDCCVAVNGIAGALPNLTQNFPNFSLNRALTELSQLSNHAPLEAWRPVLMEVCTLVMVV